jgi:hypothetical protein
MKQASRQEKSAKSVKSVVKNKTTSKIMKKETIKYIIQLIVAILTAIGSTITVVSCANGHVGEGVAFLGGTIAGTGYLHHFSTLV